MTTKQLIQVEIQTLEFKIQRMKAMLDIVDDEPGVKVCPYCKTNNLNFEAKQNMWLCAFCDRVEF